MNNIKNWIALEQAHGIGPAHLMEIYKLLDSKNLSILDIFDLNDDELKTELKNEFSLNQKIIDGIIASKKNFPKIEEIYISLIENNIEIVPFFSDKYPVRLKEKLGNSLPPFLYCYGNSDLLKQKGITILGDNNVSSRGELIAYMAAKEISRHHIPIISGLANGVDMISHKSALENSGTTIAVVPYGIMHLKIPRPVEEVFNPDKILFISPFFPDIKSDKYHAFIRNKICCAMSSAVYIVEAPVEGGIFEAAKSANKLDIPLFTTEYSTYPENAPGNKKILQDMSGIGIKGRMENNIIIPNMDKIISLIKF